MKDIMSQLILASLDKNRLKVFEKLKAFNNIGVLGGGTALSLQIGQRVSYDFDIFSYSRLPRNLWKDIKNVFGKECEKLLDFEDQLNLKTPNGIRVTFFYDDYKLLFKPVKTKHIDLMNIHDIACNKAYIIGRRPKWRDYVDLYFLLKEKHITLEKTIDLSLKKFKSDFSERLFLQQLVYWEDITDYKIQFLNEGISPDKIKYFLEERVKEFKEHEL
ncbi:hypothetical protein A2863_01640 [Candidatus Woesebacteria bacterium RIFCSPHIGHO2_01_FULL_38_9b]|uniref:Nucleotidyl transferase AbiEii/AbiGii toxin family protein n=1 Tax=Candidatus Woesebacteria bacterium RIFCSPHIGHO2_01_FULL_38_9b TaxID=1802493 RepID=A0A1F7Y0N0_9BACT|nr:MAG: hypothetical protein A2863_01640 [Candidatus Woesebacteria bacterium RIFCSPHIGHO2_01_FULL_38_9b]